MLLNNSEEQKGDGQEVAAQPINNESNRRSGSGADGPISEEQNQNNQEEDRDARGGSHSSSDIDLLLEDQLGQETFSEMSPRNIKIFKTIIIVIFIGTFAMVNFVPTMSDDPADRVQCLYDYTHEYTQKVNTWFQENSGAKNALLIIGGILSDIMVLITLGLWTYKGKTWRLPITLVLVYVAKALTSALFKYRYPDGYIWENPGFYSLTTPYGSSNDMHFTLHVCLLYVIFQELRTIKQYVLAPIAFFAFMYQSVMALCTRGAYCIDLFAAFIFGHFFFVVGEQLSYYIDVKIFDLTFQERFPNFPTECGKCKHPINQWTKNSVEDVQRAKREQAIQRQQERTNAN